MGNAVKLLNKPSRDEIALRAYHLWEEKGRQPGHDRAYWLQAEAELMAAYQGSASPTGEPDPAPKAAPIVKLLTAATPEPKVLSPKPASPPIQLRAQTADSEKRKPKAHAA